MMWNCPKGLIEKFRPIAGICSGTVHSVEQLFCMETAAKYRKFAEECRRLARQIEGKEHKAFLERMAEEWLRLAAEAQGRRAHE